MKNDKDIIVDVSMKLFQMRPSSIKKIYMGVMNYNYDVIVDNTSYIFRFSQIRNAKKIGFEFKTMKRLHKVGCLVPQPVSKLSHKNLSILVYHKLEGNALKYNSDGINLSTLSSDVIKNMSYLNELSNSKYGSPGFDKYLSSTWTDFLSNSVFEGKEYLTEANLKGLKAPQVIRFMKSYIKNIKLEDKNCLVWSDISRSNIIINNSRLSGFIDFEGCIYGDRNLCIGYLYAIEGDSDLFKSIYEKYREQYSIKFEDVIFYSLLRLLRIVKHIQKPLPNRSQKEPFFSVFTGIENTISSI